MLAKVRSGAVSGLDAVPVTVEVDIAAQGLPSFTIVGLPDKAVEESKERVRAALRNSGADFPARRITVNLAPADLPKAGPAYDLPIAVGILVASGQVGSIGSDDIYIGELSLDGTTRHTNGVLPFSMMAKETGLNGGCYVPASDAKEAAIIHGISVYPVQSLLQLFHHMSKTVPIRPVPPVTFADVQRPESFEFDFSDVVGQEQVKRALEIAAAGGHNLFMQGPPGAGKTMLARCLPSILPAMTEAEALEVTKIYSVTGCLPEGESVIMFRPFRAPHHTTSRVGLVGGGTHPMPGEISLAHRGVLFLDEFPELPRHVMEALRQPMEDGVVAISRAAGSVRYPAKFMLVAAANPCPCGNYGSESRRCTCPPGTVSRYQKRISGPLMDRIDLHVRVPAVPTDKLSAYAGTAEPSYQVKARVQKARDIETRRFSGETIHTNAEMNTRQVRKYCQLEDDAKRFLEQATVRFALSARSYYRMIKASRTVADLAGDSRITVTHVAEALQYRPCEDS